jgi:folate-binding protein YgfZ
MGLRVLCARGAALESLGLPRAPLAHATALRLLLGLPEGGEVAGVLPLEWGLHLLNGVALDKGCYRGQELLARTHWRGGAVRRRFVPAFISPAGAPHGPVACADPLAAAAGAAGGGTPPVRLPFPFLDMAWRGAPPPLAADAPLEAGAGGARVGRLVATADGCNLALLALRLDAIGHVFAHAPPAAGAADAAGGSVGGSASAAAFGDDDFANADVLADVTALHARCASQTVDVLVAAPPAPAATAAAAAPGGAPARFRVTPILPLFWRHVRHRGASGGDDDA